MPVPPGDSFAYRGGSPMQMFGKIDGPGKWLWVKTQETPREQQNGWHMGVHPPQNGGIGSDPWPNGINPSKSVPSISSQTNPKRTPMRTAIQPLNRNKKMGLTSSHLCAFGCCCPFQAGLKGTFEGENTRNFGQHARVTMERLNHGWLDTTQPIVACRCFAVKSTTSAHLRSPKTSENGYP